MTFLTKTLPRRTVLRGLGATVALPFLDAMHPGFSLRGLAAAQPQYGTRTYGKSQQAWRRGWGHGGR